MVMFVEANGVLARGRLGVPGPVIKRAMREATLEILGAGPAPFPGVRANGSSEILAGLFPYGWAARYLGSREQRTS